MSHPYHRPQPWNWFLKRRGYVLFMVRELTSVLVGLYLIVLLFFLSKFGAGEESFGQFMDSMHNPFWIVLHVLMLVGATWHSITWFNLTPRAMPVRIGEKRLADPLVALLMGYLPWIVLTILIMMGVCA